MLSFLPAPLIGVIAFFLYSLNMLISTILLLITAFLKFIIPIPVSRRYFSHIMHILPFLWSTGNHNVMRFTSKTRLDIRGVDDLSTKEWYLVLSNHQTWTDIFIMQIVLNRKTPVLKYFSKKELKRIPLLGLVCWILDFPFMYRYSKSELKKNPKLKGKDIEITKKACEKFKNQPITIVNFPEGTRFTKEKQKRRGSPFQYLLQPKAGGIALTLGAMGEYLQKILDVTIVYPKKHKTAWDFFCGRMDVILVNVKTLPINSEILGDYQNDKGFRVQFQTWLNQLWKQKDLLINDINTKEDL